MNRTCTQCSSAFEVRDDDLAFYEKVSPEFGGKKFLIPPPTLCPQCREQRRLAHRNERHLYHRKCDKTGKQIISMYTDKSVHPVYEQEVWWGDSWDASEFGREIDFNRPFFDQVRELVALVPRINLMNKQHENSEYCNFAIDNKNCYLCRTTGGSEDCYYCSRVWKGKDLIDCSSVDGSERCYELIDSTNCHSCRSLQNCNNCSDCVLGYDLVSCKSCTACFGLRNKEYHIGNTPVSKEEYEETAPELLKHFKETEKNFREHLALLPRKFCKSINAAGCTGDDLEDCKNAQVCFQSKNLEDCKYCADTGSMKDAWDVDNDDHSELVYESNGSETNYRHLFSNISWFDKECLYCDLCFHSTNLFGCVGLKRKKYCILNKEYSKEDFEALVPKVIEVMKKHNEWGEFFPAAHSIFGYNETMAFDYFPLSKEEGEERGWHWRAEEDPKEQYMGPPYEIPVDIADVSDDLVKQILTCEVTGKPYKIIPQELKFYRGMNVPIPRKSPDQRYKERLALRNPRKLWDRKCTKCKKVIQAAYSPDRPEIVYCEDCYLSTVY